MENKNQTSGEESAFAIRFGNWDPAIHEDFDQLKRITYAKKIKPENITMTSESEAASVVGTDGIYDVTLNSCTCYDFQARQLPCKHIYRLAAELGFLSDSPKLIRKAIKAFNDSIPDQIDIYRKMYFEGAISLEKLIKIVNALESK